MCSHVRQYHVTRIYSKFITNESFFSRSSLSFDRAILLSRDREEENGKRRDLRHEVSRTCLRLSFLYFYRWNGPRCRDMKRNSFLSSDCVRRTSVENAVFSLYRDRADRSRERESARHCDTKTQYRRRQSLAIDRKLRQLRSSNHLYIDRCL